ncbi:MAG: tRNA (adenosine(37)-N6)-threonylcarbamoyltransferase complex dimerization subunit type 1 TsaB [Acetobacteraceae bacterium]|nr:tRNA (adenosine(37)-N6)-threonylcarbamoyltransferase complex dimerization subunit type 1 TsaB [Acetobacteraceae bacterium]
MRILAVDAALAGCSVAATCDGRAHAEWGAGTERGNTARLPAMVASVLNEAGWRPGTLHLIAVTIGPGSFTGIRAALSVALGLGLAAGVEVGGVTVGEALVAASAPAAGRRLLTAIASTRDRVFIECEGHIAIRQLNQLSVPDGPVSVAGDAAETVAARLTAAGADVRLASVRLPHASMVAAAALNRVRAGLALRPAQPLYVENAATTTPPAPPRPPPVADG